MTSDNPGPLANQLSQEQGNLMWPGCCLSAGTVAEAVATALTGCGALTDPPASQIKINCPLQEGRGRADPPETAPCIIWSACRWDPCPHPAQSCRTTF